MALNVLFFLVKNAASVGISRFPNKLGQTLQDLHKIINLQTYVEFSSNMDIFLAFKKKNCPPKLTQLFQDLLHSLGIGYLRNVFINVLI